MMKFVIFLAVSVMWCGCDPLEGVDNCEQLKECSLNENDAVKTPFNEENYENSCRRLANFSGCVESRNLSCSNPGTRRKYEIDVKLAQIICSPEGKEVYLDAATIECLKSKDIVIQSGDANCRNTSLQQASRVYLTNGTLIEFLNLFCRAWQESVICLKQLYTANCGEKMGAFKAKMEQIIGEVRKIC